MYKRNPYYDPDDAPSGICDSCGDECSAVPIDQGIGPYEFWGDRGVHTDIHLLSPCCESEVVGGGVKVIETRTHVARKDHTRKIKAGDRYMRTLIFHWREGGPGWYTVEKRKMAF